VATLPVVTDDVKQAWFVGYTPELVAVAWVGFDDERALGTRGTRPNPAEEIWLTFMKRALADRPGTRFARPGTVIAVRIDPRTGRRLEQADAGVEELFLHGTQPRLEREPDQEETSRASSDPAP
jgi:penicillin-binding protein 1A